MKTKVLITVEGGIVQSVVTNDPDMEIAIVDYDDHSDEPVIVSVNPPDIAYKDIADTFKGKLELDKYERLARLKLFTAGFFEK